MQQTGKSRGRRLAAAGIVTGADAEMLPRCVLGWLAAAALAGRCWAG
jgi:hypothetical protein